MGKEEQESEVKAVKMVYPVDPEVLGPKVTQMIQDSTHFVDLKANPGILVIRVSCSMN